jgi:hypothetical protein
LLERLDERLGTLDLHLVVPVFERADNEAQQFFVCADFFEIAI